MVEAKIYQCQTDKAQAVLLAPERPETQEPRKNNLFYTPIL